MLFLKEWWRDSFKTKITKAANFYIRAMQYQSFAKSRIMEPLGLFNETLWILTYMAVIGIHPSLFSIVGVYISILLILIVLGKFLVWIRWMKYIQTFNNEQNNELVEILERIKAIEKKL